MAVKTEDAVQTSSNAVPMIYAYTTPGVTYHDGYIKIGYTEQGVDERIYQQTHTAGIKAKKEWQGSAIYEDGTGDTFRDTDFHAYLRRAGIKQPQDEDNEYFDPADRNEWFHVSPGKSRSHFYDFRVNRGILGNLHAIVPHVLRDEQEQAVEETADYYNKQAGNSFLWNAKPRFGKTLAAYDFVLRIGAQRVLIVTNRPAIANSWYNDYERFIGRESGFFFVSSVDGIKGKPLVLSYDEYVRDNKRRSEESRYSDSRSMGIIEFVSLQDLKGSKFFGGEYTKLQEVATLKWDVLIIDEAHEGVDTYRTDVAFNQIQRKFTLHLSGTPFKALANDKFPEGAIFNWTYVEEQDKKRNWAGPGDNPYATLPRLNLFTYQMSQIVQDELKQGIEIDGETEEYAFDLNEFFATDKGRFIHEAAVDRFLDALTTQEKFPFSTPKLRDELRHTFWLLNRVESARLLAQKLANHPVFGKYKVVLAAGDGKLDDADATMKSYDQVVDAIKKYERTITLSVGQLTTGVTIPEWTAVLMLSNIKSPALYMQAAFRAQNPCLFRMGNKYLRKENAYVFDFDPARTLVIFEQFANDLYSSTTGGRGDLDTRKKHIQELLNFFPVIGEDEDGEMISLDPEKVLSIPRKIKSVEVVRRGFMSNFLFANIGGIFAAPGVIREIVAKLAPAKEEKKSHDEDEFEGAEDLHTDEEGNIDIPEPFIIGKAAGIFGPKIYEELQDELKPEDSTYKGTPENIEARVDGFVQHVTKVIQEDIVAPALEGFDMKPRDRKRIENETKHDVEKALSGATGEFKRATNVAEAELEQARQQAASKEEIQAAEKEYQGKIDDATKKLQDDVKKAVNEIITKKPNEVVEKAQRFEEEKKKADYEDSIRDHLRGFTRTIPSFIMAYGDHDLTLSNFDTYIDDSVFQEVTSISIADFRLLRDGGDVTNPETGEVEHFSGHVFDEVVFNDSVQEFLRKQEELADYFRIDQKEDIFDYIPPQKTNQIFTPRWVVIKMVDALEAENPGCFDDPKATFADLYMKSGLYITEIVKRLFSSSKLKALYPDDKERIRHILERQMYGMAPTEIIYRIAMRFIFGFDDTASDISRAHFVKADAAAAAKDGKLAELVAKHFN